MLLLIILGVLLIGGIVLANVSYDFDMVGGITAIIAGVLLLIALIMLPLSYYGIEGEIQEYKSVVKSLEDARERNNDFENAALQQKIIDTNRWLASHQYWNNTIFDIYIPDEVAQLKPVR